MSQLQPENNGNSRISNELLINFSNQQAVTAAALRQIERDFQRLEGVRLEDINENKSAITEIRESIKVIHLKIETLDRQTERWKGQLAVWVYIAGALGIGNLLIELMRRAK